MLDIRYCLNNIIDMELKKRELIAKCVKGNKAILACTKPVCKSIALMCGDPKCTCFESHSDCKQQISLNKLIWKFQSQYTETKSLLSLIHDWYENQIKLLTLEMEHFKKEIENMEWKLEGDQHKLHTYLLEGKSDLVVPELVAKALNTLFKNDKTSFIQKEKEVKKLLSKQGEDFKKIVHNVKQFNKKFIQKNFPSTIKKFKFSQELHHPSLALVDDQIVRASEEAYFGAALLEPSLFASNYTSCKVRLRITKVTSTTFFLFGVCQLTPNFKITDSGIYNKIQHGSFTGCGQDEIDLGKSKGHRKESSNIMGYQTNDQIEIEYWREMERVEVRNTTKGTKSVSFIKSNKNLPLYFGVLLSEKDDQVRIIGSEYIQ